MPGVFGMGRGFALLLVGQFITAIGNQVQDITMMLWLKELTDSAAVMGILAFLSNLPEILLAPMGGHLADRWGRVRTMVAADLAAAFGVAGVLVIALVAPPAWALVAALFIGNAIVGTAAAGFGPALSSLIPDLAAPGRLSRANAGHQLALTAGRLAGQGVSGALYAGFGAVGALAINAVSFVLSAVASSRITEAPLPKTVAVRKGVFGETRATLHRVVADPALRGLLGAVTGFHLCLSVLPVALPFYADAVLGLPTAWLGGLYAAKTAGLTLGFALAGALGGRLGGARAVAAAGLAVGAAFGILAVTASPWAALPALTGAGAGIGFAIVNLITAIQSHAPSSERGAVMGTVQAIAGTSLPIGMALAGVALDLARQSSAGTGWATLLLLGTAGLCAFTLGLTALLTGLRPSAHGSRVA